MATRILLVLIAVLSTAIPTFGQRLPTGVRPDHYDLAFDVDLAAARFDGNETIRVRLDRSTTRIVLHAADIVFHEVTIESGSTTQTATVTLDEEAETAALTVARPLAAGFADIQIRYSGVLNDQLRGFYLSQANGRNYAVTQFESTDARRAFPSFDEPSLKATFAVTLTIPRGVTAISNGRILEDRPGPGETKHTLKFSTTPKMSTYLVAMAVGDFDCLEGDAGNIPVRVCATPDKKPLGRLALTMAGDILRYFNQYYAIAYPFGKLDMVAIPDFAAGAMENTAAIFYRETYLLADEATVSLATRKQIAAVIAHEIAHQWFGNLVTMRWWDDLWLNEGFATWMESQPLAANHPEWNIPVDEAAGTQSALNLDALRSTRPIHSNAETPAEIEATFDVIAYEKGAAVVRMIENYVGAEAFRKGVNDYLAKHAYANATSEDFWRAMTSASGKPVDRILPTFVNQPGVPLLDVTMNCASNSAAITLTQQRFSLEPSPASGAAAARWVIPICRKSAAGTESCTEMRERTQRLTEPACPSWIFFNAGARGYYRTAYPPSMLPAFAADMGTRLSPPERLSLAGDEWALVQSGRHTVADYLTLAAGIGGERTAAVLSEFAARLGFVHDYVATESNAARFEAFVRSLLRPILDDVGMEPRAGEPEERNALRSVLIAALGTSGNDAEVIARARTLVDRALSGGTPLEPSLATALLRVAARRGDQQLFDAVAAAARRATTPEAFRRYLETLAYFEDPAIVRQALARLLSDEVRSQDAPFYVRNFLANPNAGVNRQAWQFLKTQWTAILPKISISLGDAAMVTGMSSFCDPETRDDIKAFFAEHPRPTAARALDQTLERINACVKLKESQAPVLSRWLAERSSEIKN
jgi:aminopeptidase N